MICLTMILLEVVKDEEHAKLEQRHSIERGSYYRPFDRYKLEVLSLVQDRYLESVTQRRLRSD